MIRLSAAAILIFAILPAQAQVSADSLANAWSSGPSWGQFLKVIFVLAIVLALVWLTLNGLRRVTRKGGGGLQGVEVVGGLPLGPRRSLLFVKIGSSLHIIGATDHHLSNLGVVSDPAEVALLTEAAGNPNPPFSDLLRKLTGTHPGAGGSKSA